MSRSSLFSPKPAPSIQELPLGLIEVFISGSVIFLGLYELYSVNKELRKDREKAERERQEADARPPAAGVGELVDD